MLSPARTARPGSARTVASWVLADTCSLCGSRLAMIAVPWLVLSTTGSASATGVVAMLEMAAYVTSKVLTGPLVDRFGPRRVSLVADLGAAIALCAIPALATVGALSVPLVVVVMTVFGLLRGPGDAAKYVLIPRVAEAVGAPMERITGVAGTVERLSTTVGAVAAGGLVALVGPPLALACTSVLLGGAAVAVGIGLRLPPVQAPVTGSGYLVDLRAGWQWWRQDRLLVVITVMIMVTNMLDQAWTAVLLPVWVNDHAYGAEVLGTLVGVMAGGAMVGAVLATVFAARLPRLAVFVIGFLAAGMPRFAVMAADAPLGGVIAVFAVVGFASGFVNPVLGAVIFERIPQALTGRVSSLVTALCWSLMPLGGLAGIAVAGIGVAPVLWLAGGAYTVMTLMPLVVPAFRELSVRQPAGPGPSAATATPAATAHGAEGHGGGSRSW